MSWGPVDIMADQVLFRGKPSRNQRRRKAVTTLSLLPGPLESAVSRIDAAGTSDHSLEMALDHWRIKRGESALAEPFRYRRGTARTLASHCFSSSGAARRTGACDLPARRQSMLGRRAERSDFIDTGKSPPRGPPQASVRMGRGDRGSRLRDLHLSRSVGRDPRGPAQHRRQQGRSDIRRNRFASDRLTGSG